MPKRRGPRNGYRKIKRPPKDLGTPELIRKRAEAAGGGDPALTTCTLDWLRCRGLITNEQHKAGVAFARLYRQTIKRPDISAQDLDRVLKSEISPSQADPEEVELSRSQKFQRLSAALLRLSRAHYLAVREAVVFNSWKPKEAPAVSQGLQELSKELNG